MGKIDQSGNTAICLSQSRVNLNLQQQIHICLLHEEHYDVYFWSFLLISRTIIWIIAEACKAGKLDEQYIL